MRGTRHARKSKTHRLEGEDPIAWSEYEMSFSLGYSFGHVSHGLGFFGHSFGHDFSGFVKAEAYLGLARDLTFIGFPRSSPTTVSLGTKGTEHQMASHQVSSFSGPIVYRNTDLPKQETQQLSLNKKPEFQEDKTALNPT